MYNLLMSFKKNFPGLFIIIFFFLVFTYHTLYRHWTYNSNAFDLGIYTQVAYLYSQGLSPLSTLKHMNILGDHFGIILFLISPVYKLLPYPETLLTIQALFVSISGIFIYLIALDRTKDILQSSILTFAYLSAPGILSAVNFDFHLATISVLPLSLILFCWYFKKWKLYWFFLLFSILFKEDIPIFIVGLGLFSLTKKQIKLGISTLIFGLLSFYFIKFQIMAHISQGAEAGYINSSILPLTNLVKLSYLLFTQPGSFINIFFDSPTKIRTLIILYGQLLFLPFLSALSWFSIMPYLFIRFSSNLTHYWGTNFHYNANLAPFLIVSTIFVLKKIQLPKYLFNTLLILTVIISNFYLNGVVLDTFHLNPKNIEKYNYLNITLKDIPANKTISAQSPIVPHLSNRNKIYLYPEVLDADYIVLDESLIYYPMQNIEFRDKISALKSSPDWKLDQQINSLLIFSKNNSY